MSEASETYYQPTLWDMTNATSSLELPAGPSPSNLPVGQKENRSGQRLAPVSHIQQPGSKEPKTTSGTSGQPSSNSSKTSSLQESLESKLMELFDLDGSTEYNLTWKKKVTNLGLPYCQLVASIRPTGDIEFSGVQAWMSPRANDAEKRGDVSTDKRNGLVADAKLTAWPSPRAADVVNESLETKLARNARHLAEKRNNCKGVGGMTIGMVAKLTSWPSPNTHDGRRPGADTKSTQGANLSRDATLAQWMTPRSRGDARGSREEIKNLEDQARSSSTAETANTGVLNPAFSRWLMGFHATWDEFAPYSKEWDLVQQKLKECSGDQEAFSRWLVEIGLSDLSHTGMP